VSETKNEPKVTVGTVIPISWKDELEEMARAERKTVSELVREALSTKAFTARTHRPRPHAMTMPQGRSLI